MPFSTTNTRLVILISGLFFLAFYALGLIFPDVFWGTHYPSFLPGPLKIIFLSCTASCVVLPYFFDKEINRLAEKSYPDRILSAGLILLAIILSVAFFEYPIYHDTYGDSMYFRTQFDFTMQEWDPKIKDELLAFDIMDSKLGARTFYALIAFLSYHTGADGLACVSAIDGVSGMLFLAIWLLFVRAFTKPNASRWMLSLLGMTAPLLQVFFGHLEIYAPAMTTILAFLVSTAFYFKTGRLRWILIASLVFLLSAKFHSTTWFLLPVLILTILHRITGFRQRFSKLFSLKGIALGVFTPVALLGAIIYLFVTKSFNGGREYTKETLEQVVFLPVSSSDPAPLDRYNLFSPTHFFDYLNMSFLWASGALLLLLVITIAYRKKISKNHAGILVSGLAFALLLGAFFVINPLLSMPTDWDLFSIPGVALLVFAVVTVAEVPDPAFGRKIAGAVVAMCLLSACTFFVNGHRASLSKRLESSGKWNFRTYHIGSSTPLIESTALAADSNAMMQRREALVKELEPDAIQGNDLEFAGLCNEIGRSYLLDKRIPPREREKTALDWFRKAYNYYPDLRRNVYDLVIRNFMIKDYKSAHIYTRRLIKVQYPSKEKAYRISIHTALEAEAYSDALVYCREMLAFKPGDALIRKVHDALQRGTELEKVKFFFRQG